MRDVRRFWRRPAVAIERRHFDESYYRHTYADVAAASFDCFAHFMTHGWLEGRNPSKDFVTLFYRDFHLKGQRLNPLTHYAVTGARAALPTAPGSPAQYLLLQSHLVRPLFSEAFYRTQIFETEEDLLQHYLRVGWREQIAPHATFDVPEYLARHAYVASLDVSPFYHFASQRRMAAHKEDFQIEAARKAHKSNIHADAIIKAQIAESFDTGYYLLENSDVRNAGIDPLDHFLEYGWRERRNPNKYFDCAFYVEQNPGVAQGGVNPFYHYLSIGRSLGLRPHPAGLTPYPAMTAPLEAEWEGAHPANDLSGADCVIIMPVYKGHDETLASIHAILAAPQATRFALLVIDDCSPDARLVAALTALAARGLFRLAANDVNLGFVRTINTGLRQVTDRDVVLVNTDTRVFGNWLDRLVAHAARDERIATVTPFSNNATIAGYPLRNENNAIELEVDAAGLDRLAAVCNAGRAGDVPVGVGFCLFMSKASRVAVGLLDEESFGRGYGEENDFCLRATRAGFRNVLAEDVFVYHVGEVSFGLPHEKRSLRGYKELTAKYPDYPSLLKQHLHADATEEGRIRLDLMRLAREAGPAAIVHVYHALTGGISTHVRHEARKLRDSGHKAILIRVAVDDRWSIEIRSDSPTAPYCPNVRPLPVHQFRALLLDFFRWLSPRTIRIHSLAGLDWRTTTGFCDVVRDTGLPYEVTLHDYAVVCHRNHLVRPDGRYCGLPAADVCRRCVAVDRSYPEAIDPEVRRETFAHFLAGAARVIAPSRDIKLRLEAAGAPYAIHVQPHDDEPVTAPVFQPPVHPKEFNVVVLGAIGIHKGSRIILSLARDAQERKLPIRYRIIGHSDVPDEMEAAGVTETGRYRAADEAFAHLLAAEPSCIFLPSIWPETFSYTLSMAFALRCLPVVFNIGAPAERVRAKGFGVVLPYDLMFNIKALNNRLLELHDLA